MVPKVAKGITVSLGCASKSLPSRSSLNPIEQRPIFAEVENCLYIGIDKI
jgi:hypothetical protein